MSLSKENNKKYFQNNKKDFHKFFFATSSDVKFGQYKEIFASLGVLLEQAPTLIKLIEPQIENYEDVLDLIVSHPLKLTARFVAKKNLFPYILEDTMLTINAISKLENGGIGLPGADTKNWWKHLGNEGILHILRDTKNREAKFFCTLGSIIENSKYCYATSEVKGKISEEIRFSEVAHANFPLTNPHFFHMIFIPDGSDKTYAEMDVDEFMEFDYRRKCANMLYKKIVDQHYSEFKQLNVFE